MAVQLLVLMYVFKLVLGKHEPFIVGGDYVKNLKNFPWVSLLTYTDRTGVSYGCGSSILNQYMLITSAGCFTMPSQIYEVTAHVGSSEWDKGYVYLIESYKKHKKFNPSTMSHNIALCKTKSELWLSKAIKKLILVKNPPTERVTWGVEFAGWGAISDDHFKLSMKLKQFSPDLWSREDCSEIINKLPEKTFCGGDENGDDYASWSDTGNGLVYEKKILIGVYSHRDVLLSRSLAVFTNVTHYYSWIVRNSRYLMCSQGTKIGPHHVTETVVSKETVISSKETVILYVN